MLGRLEQSLERLPADEHRAERDHGHHEEAGQVLGPTVAIGVATVGGAAADDEGDPERHRGQGIAEVVDGVGQQGGRAGLEAR